MPPPNNPIEKAQSEVKELLDAAEKEIASWIQEAKIEGEKQGSKQAENLLEKLAVLEKNLKDELQTQALQVGYSLAQKLLKDKLNDNKEGFLHLVTEALESVKGAAQISLRVHPQDAAFLGEHKQKLINVLGRAKDIDIREDKTVAKGGVVIHTEAGAVDAQPQTQLEELARTLNIGS